MPFQWVLVVPTFFDYMYAADMLLGNCVGNLFVTIVGLIKWQFVVV